MDMSHGYYQDKTARLTIKEPNRHIVDVCHGYYQDKTGLTNNQRTKQTYHGCASWILTGQDGQILRRVLSWPKCITRSSTKSTRSERGGGPYNKRKSRLATQRTPRGAPQGSDESAPRGTNCGLSVRPNLSLELIHLQEDEKEKEKQRKKKHREESGREAALQQPWRAPWSIVFTCIRVSREATEPCPAEAPFSPTPPAIPQCSPLILPSPSPLPGIEEEQSKFRGLGEFPAPFHPFPLLCMQKRWSESLPKKPSSSL